MNADKGKPTVGLTRIKYVDKMKKLLSDPSLFMKLTCNRKPKSERELPDMLHRLKKGSHLSEAMYRRLFLPDRAITKPYGLPKIHTQKNCHLEPIASFIGSLTYSLSKFLVVLLGPTTGKNGFTVRNSRELVQKQFL